MTMPNPPGRQIVAPGEIVASDWGNAVWDQTRVRFADATQRDTQWPSPPDGARCHLDSPKGDLVYRAGQWRADVGEFYIDSVLVGPWPIAGYRWVGGTAVFTVNTSGGGVLNIPNPGSTLVTVLPTAGEDSSVAAVVSSFDYHPNYCQCLYSRGGAPVSGGAVRVNYLALIG